MIVTLASVFWDPGVIPSQIIDGRLMLRHKSWDCLNLWWECKGTTDGHEGSLWGNGNVLKLECGDGFTTLEVH